MTNSIVKDSTRQERPVGILCAMEIEIRDLLSSLQEEEIIERAGYRFHAGRIGGSRVVLVRCGIGKVNAARGTQMMIDLFDPACILNSGIAGGTREGLHIGDIVIGTEFVQHDFDVTAFGHAKGYLCTGERDDEATVFCSDPAIVARLEGAASALSGGRSVHRGRIASGDQFIASLPKKREIAADFQATAAEMEGASIAQTAAYSGVPFAVLRVISDLADGSAPENYDAFEAEAADLSAAIMRQYLQQSCPSPIERP